LIFFPALASFLASCCLLVLFTSFTYIVGLLFLSLRWCWPFVSRAYVLNYTSDTLSNDPRAQSECEISKRLSKSLWGIHTICLFVLPFYCWNIKVKLSVFLFCTACVHPSCYLLAPAHTCHQISADLWLGGNWMMDRKGIAE
jgi:hypothetical protein